MVNKKIYLSKPNFTDSDLQAINRLLNNYSNKIEQNPLLEFENSLSKITEVSNVVAVSSGSAAIHLALISLKIPYDSKIIVPDLTFAATAFPINYIGAKPVFVDVHYENWNIDLDLLEKYLKKCKKENLPRAIISVDLFGRTCDYDKLFKIIDNYEIPLIIDAAESLGSLYKGSPTTSFGTISVTSFNYNKIVTTTGGGALLTNNKSLANLSRLLSNQARDPVHWYEHSRIGYNYRLSPVLAALGLSQLERLDTLVAKRKQVKKLYTNFFENVPGIEISQDSYWEKSNAWLTTVRFDSKLFPGARNKIYEALKFNEIESRFIWKPMSMQPIFKNAESVLNQVSKNIFEESLCLPSSDDLTMEEVNRICNIITKEICTL